MACIRLQKRTPMKLRTLVAGLVLAIAITPAAAAAPKGDSDPQRVGGGTEAVSTDFYCSLIPWFPLCHPR